MPPDGGVKLFPLKIGAPPLATSYHLAVYPVPTFTIKFGIGSPWHISSLFPVGGGIVGHEQSGATTGIDIVHSLFDVDVTVIITGEVPIGMPVTDVAPTVPALAVTVPPVAVKSTLYVNKSAEHITLPITNVGIGVTFTVKVASSVQPLASVTTTLYVVVLATLLNVAVGFVPPPLDHTYPLPPVALSVTSSPEHI